MAESSAAEIRFSCSICLDLLKDPVTITCGHNYCMSCIKGYWDREDHDGVYSCPQCRQNFTSRPVLGRNNTLAEVVEKLRTQINTAPEVVECDSCTGKKHNAVKSCLVCLASYCQTHLQPHYGSPAFKKHKLIDATRHLQEKICSHHDKPLEIYCHTDQQCICYLCTIDEHRGHNTILAEKQTAEIKQKMGETREEFKHRIQMREKELQELNEAVDSVKSSAKTAEEDSERIFTDTIHSLETRRSEVTELIRGQKNHAVSQAVRVKKKLEEEINELKKRDSELEQLSHTEDDIYFLQRYHCLRVTPELGFGPRTSVHPHCSYGNVRSIVSELKNEVQKACETKMVMIRHTVNEQASRQTPDPRTKAELLKHSHQLTLNLNTACKQLHLLEGNKMVKWKSQPMPYPDDRGRFSKIHQVLCTERLTGQCYWEVEWRGQLVGIAVAYENISRKGWGNNSRFGYNEKSWCMYCAPTGYYLFPNGYSFWHNNKKTEVSGAVSPKIGVYLNQKAGTLSFYSVSDTMTLLHRVQTKFKKPLYAGFSVFAGTVKIC